MSAIKTGARKQFFLFTLHKKQKFIVGVCLLSIGLFFVENIFGRSSIFFVVALAIATDLLLLWAIYRDIKENFTPQIFVLPFFYSLSFGLFYSLTPARLLTRILLTTLFALGIYALFRSQNIFSVAAIRTIALLGAARIVSFIITILSFMFLTNIIFSLHLNAVITGSLIAIVSFFLVNQSLWTITLQKAYSTHFLWSFALSLCLSEIATVLWFWPTNPTIISIFLGGFFYTTVGLSQVWLDKRLFRGILWEYVWIGIVVFIGLIFLTSWGR